MFVYTLYFLMFQGTCEARRLHMFLASEGTSQTVVSHHEMSSSCFYCSERMCQKNVSVLVYHKPEHKGESSYFFRMTSLK